MTPSLPHAPVPELWIKWRSDLLALVQSLSKMLALYRNPTTPIDRTAWDQGICDVERDLVGCRTAANAVASETERVTISRTLKRFQVDAEAWAEWMLSNAKLLDIDDTNAVQRWHAPLMLPIQRLSLGLMSRAIHLEFLEEAQRRSEKTFSQVSEGPPLPKVQRRVLELLRGRAMTADKLSEEVICDRSTLVRTHLKQLMNSGRVKNARRVGGYYRPDAPPTSL